MTIYNALKQCDFTNKTVMFDTNVWIYVNGFDPRPDRREYSDFYKSVLEQGNEIVVSDLILGEFVNACPRIEMRLQNEQLALDGKKPLGFKDFRSLPTNEDIVASVRDTALNLCDDCVIDQLQVSEFSLPEAITASAAGKLDLSDIIIREHCKIRDFVLVTHDRDFENEDLNVATANRRWLKSSGLI